MKNSKEGNPNSTKGGISGKVLYAGNRQKSSGCVESTGVFMGGGRDNTGNPKYSKYEDTNFSKKNKD